MGRDREVARQGGRIDINTGLLLVSPESEISADAGVGIGGVVHVNSPVVNLEGQVLPPPVEFLDASSMMLASCAARRSGERAGSFTVARWRGLPVSPEGPLLAFDPIGMGDALAAAPGSAVPPVAAAPDAEAEASDEPPASAALPMRVALAQGEIALRGGRVEEASARWSQASELAARAGDASGQSDALRGVGQAQQAQGAYAASIAPLAEALTLARASGDAAREAAALGALGNAYVALRELETAERYLTEAVHVAREAGDAAQSATRLNDLGNLYAIRGAYAQAQSAYAESAEFARAAADALREAQALANAGRAALAQGQAAQASELLWDARRRAQALETSRAQVALRIHLGRSYAQLAQLDPIHRREGLVLGHRALRAAIADAESLGAARLLAYAQGNLGALYGLEGRTPEALVLTRQALATAERAEAADLMARWHGQAGQLLWAAGEKDAAVAAYRRAVDLLEQTRPELRAHYGATDAEFQRAVAPTYLALVDALLQMAGEEEDATRAQARLADARAIVERWKAAELRDYFRDECVAELEARASSVEALEATAAIVYPIELPDRLELLVSLPSGIVRYPVAVDAETLTRAVRGFRRAVVKRTTHEYLAPAQQLHGWLVAPYTEELAAQGIDTLVFVPGGALRTIPLAALHDGQGFLVERYAVAVTPSLNLLAPKPLEPAKAQLLLAGVSEPVQGFPELERVPTELAAIHALYGGEVLLDEEFRRARFEQELRERPPAVVHIASHAKFTGDPRTSFVLTHDDRLSMERLSTLVGAGRFGEEPLELLLLSACETAAGDDRAALGLAGVAIRAGARSAVGSLWTVSDEATAELVVAFYEALGEPHTSKAQALRRAQTALLTDVRYDHPFFWAPFLVINNWL
jgi:CHAT domain-containing protein